MTSILKQLAGYFFAAFLAAGVLDAGDALGAQFLVNVDFGAGPGPSAKVGLAATGQTTNDFWNFYTRDNGRGGWRTNGALTNLEQADGAPTEVGLIVANAPGAWGSGSSDPMYQDYIYPLDESNATVTLTNLPAGRYDLYVYGGDGNYQLKVGETDLGTQRTHEDPVANPPHWRQGVQYALFQNLEVTQAGEPVELTVVQPGIGGPAVISGLQITQTAAGAGIPPSILTQPVGQTVNMGGTATFSVAVSGTPPLTCQWTLNGNDMPGATNGVLTVSDAQVADAGIYRVLVASPYGSAVSSNAVLTVLTSEPPSGEPFLVDVDFGAGPWPSAKTGLAATGQTTNDFWNFYTRDDGQGGWRTFGALTNLKQADGTPTTVGLTVANAPGAWGNGSSDPMYHDYIYPFDGGNVTVTVSNLPTGQYDVYVYGSDGNYQVTSGGIDEGIQTTRDDPVTNPPHWKEGVQYALFQQVKVTQAGQSVLLTVRPGVGGYAIISGLQIAQSVPAPPSIVTQPQSLTINEGGTASFNVAASGSEPLSYQWFKDNAILERQTDATLLLTNVQLADEGVYRVSVSNTLGSVVSSNAMLTVLTSEPPHGGSFLLDVDFGAGPGPSAKAGLAATGHTTNDFWNFYTRDDGQGNWRTFGALTNLKQADGTPTGVGLTVANAPGAWGNGSSDPMYHDYIYPFDGGNVTVAVTNLPAGQYDIYVYGSDGNYEIASGGVSYGPQTTYDYPVANPPEWRMGIQYALFRSAVVTAGQPLVLTVRPGTGHYAVISGMQITPASKPLLVNVDFGANSGPSAKVGLAATGQTTNDFWNFYTRDDGQGGWRTFGALTNLKQADGIPTGVGLTVANAPGAWGNGSSDPMYHDYIYPFNGGNVTVTLTNLPAGHYDLYVYGSDGNYEVSAGASSTGVQQTYEYPVVNPPKWKQGVQYALFQDVEVSSEDEPVVLTVRPGTGGYAIISGLQITGEPSQPAAKQNALPGGSRLLMRTTSQGVSLQFSGMAMSGHAVVLYDSTNLLDWTAISTNPPTLGAMEYFDSYRTNEPQRFYRLGEAK